MVNTRQPNTRMCEGTKPERSEPGGRERRKRKRRKRREDDMSIKVTGWDSEGFFMAIFLDLVGHQGCAFKGTKFHNEIKLGTTAYF